MAEPCIILAEISRSAETCPLYTPCSENVLEENPEANYRHSLGYQAGLIYERGMGDAQCQRSWKSLEKSKAMTMTKGFELSKDVMV